jgi:catechol 2,3-dioxygenase-like lactoylglutathione lyase family enzyme
MRAAGPSWREAKGAGRAQVDAKLWNVGVKVEDVDTDVAFFVALGAKLLIRERTATPAGEIDYAILAFGGTRLFLTPKPVFEEKLSELLQPGLTHAVFEVEDLGPQIERITALGTEVLLPPTEISAKFGTRKIAFFRSPGGLVFEVMQIIEEGGND